MQRVFPCDTLTIILTSFRSGFHVFLDMDKEDALVCFQDHIKLLEQEYDDEKEREKRSLKRRQRKNREAFLVSFWFAKWLKVGT